MVKGQCLFVTLGMFVKIQIIQRDVSIRLSHSHFLFWPRVNLNCLCNKISVFQDILWTICFVASGDFLVREGDDQSTIAEWHKQFWYKNIVIPIICLLPLLIRFNQCLRRYADTGKRIPNLANAFKVSTRSSHSFFLEL